MDKKEQVREAQRRNTEATRRLLLAYSKVFGRPGHRSTAQEIVWRDMEKRGYKHGTTMVPLAKEAPIDPLRMAQAEGCRIFHLQTEEFVTHGSLGDESTQPAN